MTCYKCDRCGAITVDKGNVYKIEITPRKYSKTPGVNCFLQFGSSIDVELCDMCLKTVFAKCKKIALGEEETE